MYVKQLHDLLQVLPNTLEYLDNLEGQERWISAEKISMAPIGVRARLMSGLYEIESCK